MKLTSILALVGFTASKELRRINTYDPAYLQFIDGIETYHGDDAINLMVDVTRPDCVYLDETEDELKYQIDMFSRTLDPRHWTNVLNIAKKLGPHSLAVHTWELYDKAFSFPRIRRYQFVQENMDMLEHF